MATLVGADGVHEDILTSLYLIPELKVISRTSVMTYKGAHKSLPQIARDLNVDAVVEGTKIPAGSHVLLMWGSANRDAGHFADASAFDPEAWLSA